MPIIGVVVAAAGIASRVGYVASTEQRPVNLRNGYYNHPTSCFLALQAGSPLDSMLSSAWVAMTAAGGQGTSGVLAESSPPTGAPALLVANALGGLDIWEGSKQSIKKGY